MRRAVAIGLVVAAAAVLGVLALSGGRDPEPPRPERTLAPAASVQEPGPAPESSSPQGDRIAGARALIDGRVLPRSLAGTVPDGQLRVDAHGDLVVDRELRRRFDYFLTATGEEPREVVRARLVAQLSALPDKAAGQALSTLDRYLAWLESAAAMPSPAAAADARERLEAFWRTRRALLGDDLDQAFFGQEEADDLAALASTTSVASDAPAAPAAAARLSELARQRAEWAGRVDDFRRERDAILGDAALTGTQRQWAIDGLLEQSFRPNERLRLRALGEAPRAK
jgi:lipase chaperone LimK